MDNKTHAGTEQILYTGQSALLDGYLTPDELARGLGVSVRTLGRWNALRQGPPRISIGRQVLYSRVSVDNWLASRETAACQTDSRSRRLSDG